MQAVVRTPIRPRGPLNRSGLIYESIVVNNHSMCNRLGGPVCTPRCMSAPHKGLCCPFSAPCTALGRRRKPWSGSAPCPGSTAPGTGPPCAASPRLCPAHVITRALVALFSSRGVRDLRLGLSEAAACAAALSCGARHPHAHLLTAWLCRYAYSQFRDNVKAGTTSSAA